MKMHHQIQVKPVFCETGLMVYRAEDEVSNRGMDFTIRLSKHSVTRSSQRGIESYKLAIALQYGEVFMKQGLIYYVLGENNIPEQYSTLKSQLKNIVVVCCGRTDEVITCYRSANPFSRIKHKSKRLYVHQKQAITVPRKRFAA